MHGDGHGDGGGDGYTGTTAAGKQPRTASVPEAGTEAEGGWNPQSMPVDGTQNDGDDPHAEQPATAALPNSSGLRTAVTTSNDDGGTADDEMPNTASGNEQGTTVSARTLKGTIPLLDRPIQPDGQDGRTATIRPWSRWRPWPRSRR